ncbi:hypothetical protein ACP3V5_19160 [Vibrio maritimus]
MSFVLPADIVIPAQAGIYHQRTPSFNQDSCLHRNDGAIRLTTLGV